jgi:farnesyl-diphosphate farnesyltransferase
MKICVFYLVLRGLDTVEDDMTIPLEVKVPLLTSFHEMLREPGWQFFGSKFNIIYNELTR